MSPNLKAILAVVTLSVVFQATYACGTDGVPCRERQVNPDPPPPGVPEFCQVGRPEAAVDCACLLLIKKRVKILFKNVFLDVCEKFIGREAIEMFGPRGCRKFGIKLNRRLKIFKVLRLIIFVNKILPKCLPVDVPPLVVVGIKKH